MPQLTPSASMTRSPADPIDRQLWDRLIRTHDNTLRLSLLAMGLRPDRARELAQATWMRLMEKHAQGELPELNLPGLAVRQARFLALDTARSERAEQRRISNVVSLQPDRTRANDLEQRVLCRQQISHALAVLAGCSLSAQQVFRILYTPPPRNHEDAARELGLSVQRVRQIVCETRKKLREALKETTR